MPTLRLLREFRMPKCYDPDCKEEAGEDSDYCPEHDPVFQDLGVSFDDFEV